MILENITIIFLLIYLPIALAIGTGVILYYTLSPLIGLYHVHKSRLYEGDDTVQKLEVAREALFNVEPVIHDSVKGTQ